MIEEFGNEVQIVVASKKLTKLRELTTESLRVQRGGGETITYVNVGHALEDARSRQNHVIFARRGCGKTLLLHDSARQLPPDIKAIYLNCEDFKRHTFPNVLIEILSALFREIEKNLTGWFGRKAKSRQLIHQIIAKLQTMRHEPDTEDEDVKRTLSTETAREGRASGGLHGNGQELSASISGSRKRRRRSERLSVTAKSYRNSTHGCRT